MEIYHRAYLANPDVPKDELVVLMGVTWSDDFDPNSSIKANRGGVWIRTVTFVSESFHSNRLDDTYTISIGQKQDNHDPIEERFKKELHDLSNGKNNMFYSMNTRSNIRVHFEIIAFLGDQPERRGINQLMLGNIKFHSRYSYAADIKAIAKYLPMCMSCLQRTRRNPNFLNNNKNCNVCLQWNMTSNNKLLKYDPPKYFPHELLPLDGKLVPTKLSFNILKSTVQIASEKFMDGTWNESCVRSYVSTFGINQGGMNKIIEHCNSMKTLKNVTMGAGVDRNVRETILSDQRLNNDRYEFWKGGVYWNSSLELDVFCDVIMHLLFLGITKASKELLSLWLKETKVSSEYHGCIKQLFLPIADLGLDWCKII